MLTQKPFTRNILIPIKQINSVCIIIFRLFRLSCAKCKTLLYPEDMIFREGGGNNSNNNNNNGGQRVFHYNCLTCSLCGLNLRQGDEYIVQQSSDDIVCKAHFDDQSVGGGSAAGVSVAAAAGAAGAAAAANKGTLHFKRLLSSFDGSFS